MAAEVEVAEFFWDDGEMIIPSDSHERYGARFLRLGFSWLVET